MCSKTHNHSSQTTFSLNSFRGGKNDLLKWTHNISKWTYGNIQNIIQVSCVISQKNGQVAYWNGCIYKTASGLLWKVVPGGNIEQQGQEGKQNMDQQNYNKVECYVFVFFTFEVLRYVDIFLYVCGSFTNLAVIHNANSVG